MTNYEQRITDALQAARMYYYQDMKTETIARELKVSRSTVSRMISFAKAQGLVELRIRDPREGSQPMEQEIRAQFGVRSVSVVEVRENAPEQEWLDQVALFAANYLNTIMDSNKILGIAWGTTISAIAAHLTPKSAPNSDIVQLNGAGNTQSLGINYAGEIFAQFAKNFGSRTDLFPVPTFFDYPETKTALWRERSIQRILEMQRKAHILLYSIGTLQATPLSHVYSGGYLETEDLDELERERVAGDIATVMFRADGSYADIPINRRASGPDLALFRKPEHGICVVSGRSKARGLQAALKGGFLTDLIVDKPTARLLLSFPK